MTTPEFSAADNQDFAVAVGFFLGHFATVEILAHERTPEDWQQLRALLIDVASGDKRIRFVEAADGWKPLTDQPEWPLAQRAATSVLATMRRLGLGLGRDESL